MFCQLVLLPIVAYFLIIILRTPVELALGVMLIAAAPGGVTSNVLNKIC
jgi:BASS family bile acid:Na+ symporter